MFFHRPKFLGRICGNSRRECGCGCEWKINRTISRYSALLWPYIHCSSVHNMDACLIRQIWKRFGVFGSSSPIFLRVYFDTIECACVYRFFFAVMPYIMNCYAVKMCRKCWMLVASCYNNDHYGKIKFK